VATGQNPICYSGGVLLNGATSGVNGGGINATEWWNACEWNWSVHDKQRFHCKTTVDEILNADRDGEDEIDIL